MDIKIPKNINFVLDTLEKAGFEAFIVGGCVRDTLLGNKPDDFDVNTNALPDTVVSLFEHTVCTGLKHGTVTVLSDNQSIEVTTYRTEFGYSDSRHPDSVKFVTRVEDDLARRDFTVNAICYNPKTGIIDPFGGIQDIKTRTLRAVGNPDVRFKEDALRILRLFRFSAKLGFDIEENTLKSALKHADLLDAVSRERIAVEIRKTAIAENPTAIMPLINSGALEFLGIKKCRDLSPVSKLEPKENLRLFAMLYLCDCDVIDTITQLKYSNNIKNYCDTALRIVNHNFSSKSNIKKALNISSVDAVQDILNFKNVILGENTDKLNMMLDEILKANEPYKISDLKLNGNDLADLGITGDKIGENLNRLLELVIENPTLNTRENLIKRIK